MQIPVIVIALALLLPACVTESKSGKAVPIDWEPPVWSSETIEKSEQPKPDEDWTPPVWSATGSSDESTADAEPDDKVEAPAVVAALKPSNPQPAPDTSIPEWSSDVNLAATSDQDAAGGDSPRWVSLASLLEGRIGHDLDEPVRQNIDGAFNRVLGKNRTGAGMPWSDDGTNSRGRVVVTRFYDAEGGILCGVVDHRHQIGNIDVGGSLTACRAQSGHWVVQNVRWWGAEKIQASAPEGNTPSGSWQTLSDELAAPASNVESTGKGNWSTITE